MTRETTDQQGDLPILDAAAAAFVAHGLLRGPHGPAALEAARERALVTLAACDAPSGSAGMLAAPFAGSLLVELVAERAPSPPELAALALELAAAGVPALALLRAALNAPALQTLEPARARDVALAVLAACARLRHVSAWFSDGLGRVACAGHVGQGSPSPAASRLARAAIARERPAQTRTGEMQAVAILRAGEPVGALVARRRGGRERTAAFLAEARTPLAAIVERESLLASNAASERMLLAASERRLTRLGFDLHDGPLQELLLVGEDLALFRRQLAIVLEGRRGKEVLGGRLDDLDARLVGLERGLRRISSSVHSDVLVGRPFRDALRDLLEPFTARSGIEPTLRCDGDLESISTSQRLAVLNVVGEALNNVREHGEASAVSVTITLHRDGLRARVRDDGRGFDVESELLRAARSGHMGLAGMHERVRLLDGHCRVDSRAGGPTEVTLALPRWRAPVAEAGGEQAAQGNR
jgi:signal transduction histidine kinase